MVEFRAIVTGGSSGIGRATALRLAQEGHSVAITYGRNLDGAETTASRIAEISGSAPPIRQMALQDSGSICNAIEDLDRELGGVDILVNNAGALSLKPFLEVELDDLRNLLEVNLTGSFVAAQAAARLMVSARTEGRIVNIASVHDLVPLDQGSAYCISKAGIAMLTKCMALELAPHGITVNTVSPGEVATPMSGAEEEADVATRLRPDLPVPRPAHPDEVAAAISYLIGLGANYVTGSTIRVDGGMLLTAAIPNQRRIMAALSEN